MPDILRHFSLQMFADGGDGGSGDGGSTAPASDGAGDIEIPDSIPARARETYKKAVARTRGNAQTSSKPTPSETDATAKEDVKTHVPYSELIKSDEYRDEHEEWTKKTINERLKKYKGQEEQLTKSNSLLALVGNKYGLDANSATFMDDIAKAIEQDDSYYEKYAMEHDVTPSVAREIVTLERKVSEQNAREAEMRQQEEQRQRAQALLQSAERTKQKFPNFDLNTEMQNEQFRRILAATNGDTTAAYRTVHWDDVVPQMVQASQQQAVQQTANSVKANKSRPVEAALSNTAPSVQTSKDYSKMNLAEIRKQADEWRRKSK